VRQLVRYNIGSLVVFGSDGRRRRMLGIVTERDILRAQANRRKPLERLLVREVMSVEVVCTTVDKPLTDAMRLMTEHRIRHLPVVDDNGELFGIVSIGDIVKAQHDELVAENHFMRTYIRG
jgi:CBS domain-containing protein